MKKIESFLKREAVAESVTRMLEDDRDSLKIKILINEIERTQQKVKRVLQRLTDIDDSDVIRTLESLRMHEQITDEQFRKMAAVDNNLASYAKAMTSAGNGLWLGRR